MSPRNPIVLALRCKACDIELDEFELTLYEMFEGLCEGCFNTSDMFDDDDFTNTD